MPKQTPSPKPPKASKISKPSPQSFKASDLSDREVDGQRLFDASRRGKARIVPLDDQQTIYWSSRTSDTAYTVTRKITNRRGTLIVAYTCSCPDAKKYLRRDCEHQFAEKLRRGEAVITGRVPASRPVKDKAGRRPARKRLAEDGRSIKSAQRDARKEMPNEIPRLVLSLKHAYDLRHPNAMALRHGKLTADSLRVAALLLKVAEGKSADAMVSRYQQLIEDGRLPLRRAPHQNTLGEWMNDDSLTPVLEEMLSISAEPFRLREIGAIIDSSKVSQLRVAHARLVDYGTDKRPNAEWMKAHALIGVETMVVMAVMFSSKKVHDSKFLKKLVEKIPKAFALRFLLGDRA
ncbi:MAG TPA: transposase, partial [Candidatus Elarobacter sp.]|nr:transposase [Candidatus Elarobacter sp.]